MEMIWLSASWDALTISSAELSLLPSSINKISHALPRLSQAVALTVETDLATNELAWQFNLGRCIFCGRCEEVCPTAAIKLSQE
ncbi:4Fe-4S binding protein, partial [Salmonella enterica subsp. enterica serovar Anatum]|nr:4Fe-4S binding protein [Salmonella enterica subsp. enterica serovar Anatum]